MTSEVEDLLSVSVEQNYNAIHLTTLAIMTIELGEKGPSLHALRLTDKKKCLIQSSMKSITRRFLKTQANGLNIFFNIRLILLNSDVEIVCAPFQPY